MGSEWAGTYRRRVDFLQIAVRLSSAGVQQLKVIMINSILADSGDQDTQLAAGLLNTAFLVLLDCSLRSHVLDLYHKYFGKK